MARFSLRSTQRAIEQNYPTVAEAKRKEQAPVLNLELIPGPQILAAQSEADELFFGGSAGGGKAVSLDTPIPTLTGWKLMGEIAVGDQVFDEQGIPCNVVAVGDILLNRPCYRVVFSDGAEIIADEQHEWLTTTDQERVANQRRTEAARQARRESRPSCGSGKKPWLAALNSSRVHEYKEISQGQIRTTLEIAQTLKYRGYRNNHAVVVAKPLQIPDCTELPIDPYILGAWLGDGCTTSGLYTSADECIIQHFRDAGYSVTKGSAKYAYYIRGFKQQLRALGVLGGKHIPMSYLRSSTAQRIALLQGLMDTDGYCKPNGMIEFTTTSVELADGVIELLHSLGIKVSQQLGRAKLNGRDIGPKWRLLFVAPFPSFRMERKLQRQKLEGFRSTTSVRYIVDVQPVESVPVRCIQVDSPSHLYLAGREMIPTHNSFLLLILAATQHRRSIIFRRTYPRLKALIEKSKTLFTRVARYNSNDKMWRGLPGDRTLEFGAVEREDDKVAWQGVEHDLKSFDEITEFSQTMYVFITGWNRSAVEGQRSRVICTGNPPTNEQGQWIIDYWGPWLKRDHPNPAQPGELRWFITNEKGEQEEVPNGEPIEREGEIYQPRSRTFIPASLEDNPYLARTNYRSVLQSLPEPLRSLLLKGRFDVSLREDHAWQVIPTPWVKAAMERWQERGLRYSVLGVDVSRGGADETILAGRYQHWCDHLKTHPGNVTLDGSIVAKRVVAAIAGMPAEMLEGMDLQEVARYAKGQDCAVHIDIVGVGSSPYDFLKMLKVQPLHGLSSGERSVDRKGHYKTDRTGRMGFRNRRSEWWWNLRERLDPQYDSRLELPPDDDLLIQLTTPRWTPVPVTDPDRISESTKPDERIMSLIQVESKDELKKRLNGKSPDKADAVVYAFAEIETKVSTANWMSKL